MLHKLGLFKTTDSLHQFQLRVSGSLADQIEIFWDDVTGTIRAWYYTSQSDYDAQTGEEVFDETPVIYTAIPLAVYSDYKFCEGTTLVQFVSRWNFPFYVRETTANSYQCSSIVCDIAFIGAPLITPAANADTTGRVIVEAQSSNGTIEYFPGPFTYGYGSPIGDFLLPPGIHQIFAIDASDCYTSVTIEIPIGGGETPTHFLKYFASYSNLFGEKTRIEILEKAYEGAPIELGTQNGKPNPAASPFSVSWGKAQEAKNHPIKVSEASIKLISYIDYEFLEFFTNETQYYKVQIKRGDESGPLLWWGYVTPEFYGEPYIHPPYVIDLVCNDGLGDLQNIPFALVSSFYQPLSPYTGRMTHLNVIVECLKKIGNDLPIYTAINTIEDSMGFEANGPQLLKYTFITSVDKVFPNDLERGVKYIFKITGNNNINLYYGTELIYSPSGASTGLINGDFSNGLTGWTQIQNGISSEPWVTLVTEFYDHDVYSNSGMGRTHYLIQAHDFVLGVEYTGQISLYKVASGLPEATYRLKIAIGNTGPVQIVFDSGDFDNTRPNLQIFDFTFIADANYLNLYIWGEFSITLYSYANFVINYVTVVNEIDTTQEIVFEYTPTVAHENITIDVVGGPETTLKIYEAIQDAFNQIYVNTDNYTAEGGLSCFAVIQEQLKPYGARMYQSAGAWYIVRFDQQNAEYLRNKYDKNGVFIESEYFQPILNIVNPAFGNDNIWINNDMMLEMLGGFRNQSVEQNLGYVENLILGGEFPLEEWTSTVGTGLKHFITNTWTNGDPIWYELTQINKDNYGFNFKNAVIAYSIFKAKQKLKGVVLFQHYESKPAFPSIGEKGVVYIDDMNDEFWLWDVNNNNYLLSLYPDQRIPAGLSLNDWVLVDSTDPYLSGYYQVNSNESWKRFEIGRAPILIDGVFYSIETTYIDDDTPKTRRVVSVPDADIEYRNSQVMSVQNVPVFVDAVKGDVILIKIKKKYTQPSNKGVPVFIGIEIKMGEKYLFDTYQLRDFYNFLQFFVEDEKGFSDIEIPIVFEADLSGELTIKIWVYSWGLVDFINIDVLTGQVIDSRFTYPNLIIDSIYAAYLPGGIYPPENKIQVMNNSKKFHTIPDPIEVLHGDAPEEILNRDKVYSYYLTFKDGTLTKKWHRKGFYESKNLLKLLLEIMISNNLNNNEFITGSIFNLLSLNDAIYDPQNPDRLFMMNYISWDEMNHTSNVEIVEIERLFDDSEAAFTYGFTIGFKS